MAENSRANLTFWGKTGEEVFWDRGNRTTTRELPGSFPQGRGDPSKKIAKKWGHSKEQYVDLSIIQVRMGRDTLKWV